MYMSRVRLNKYYYLHPKPFKTLFFLPVTFWFIFSPCSSFSPGIYCHSNCCVPPANVFFFSLQKPLGQPISQQKEMCSRGINVVCSHTGWNSDTIKIYGSLAIGFSQGQISFPACWSNHGSTQRELNLKPGGSVIKGSPWENWVQHKQSARKEFRWHGGYFSVTQWQLTEYHWQHYSRCHTSFCLIQQVHNH